MNVENNYLSSKFLILDNENVENIRFDNNFDDLSLRRIGHRMRSVGPDQVRHTEAIPIPIVHSGDVSGTGRIRWTRGEGYPGQ